MTDGIKVVVTVVEEKGDEECVCAGLGEGGGGGVIIAHTLPSHIRL